MPTPSVPTSRLEHDYARYGRRRTGAPPLPAAPGEIGAYAQRVYRSRLGPILSASLLPAFSLTLAVRYLYVVLFPSLGTTHAGADQVRQVGDFALGIAIGLAVAIPLSVLALAGLISIAYREAGTWMEAIAEPTAAEARAMFARTAGTIALGLLMLLAAALGGVALLILGGLSTAALGPDSPVGGILVVIGMLLVVGGGLYAAARLPRVLTAAPVALYERTGARVAIRRTKQLMAPRAGSLGANTHEGTVFGVMFLTMLVILGIFSLTQSVELADYVAGLFASPLLRLVASETVAALPLYLTVLFIAPYISLLVVVGYFERRVSAEGLDIELMAARLERTRPLEPGR